ncbi:hypothetical protein DFH28DRAFT_951237 [Melampsora americana]|nr:hypothetical protein DFH28DRAFT_951237 [Melampsora americana]
MFISSSIQALFLTLFHFHLIYLSRGFIDIIPNDPLMNMWRGIDSAPLIVRRSGSDLEPTLSSSFKTWSPKGGWIPSDPSTQTDLATSLSHTNADEEKSLISSHQPTEGFSSEKNVGPYESIIIQTLDHLKEPELTHKEKTSVYAHLMEILRTKPDLKPIFLNHFEDPSRVEEVEEVEKLWKLSITAHLNDQDEFKRIEEIYGFRSTYQIIIRKFFDLDFHDLNSISDLQIGISKYLSKTPMSDHHPRSQALHEIQSRLKNAHHEIQKEYDENLSNDKSNDLEIEKGWNEMKKMKKKWNEFSKGVIITKSNQKKSIENFELQVSEPRIDERNRLREEFLKVQSNWKRIQERVKNSNEFFGLIYQRYLNLNHQDNFQVQEFRERLERFIESKILIDDHLEVLKGMRHQLLEEVHRVKAWEPSQGWKDVPQDQRSSVIEEALRQINDPSLGFGERGMIYNQLESFLHDHPDRLMKFNLESERNGKPNYHQASAKGMILSELKNPNEAEEIETDVLLKRFIALNKANADSINSLREDLERVLLKQEERLKLENQDDEKRMSSEEASSSSSSSSTKPSDLLPHFLTQADQLLIRKMRKLLISEHYRKSSDQNSSFFLSFFLSFFNFSSTNLMDDFFFLKL